MLEVSAILFMLLTEGFGLLLLLMLLWSVYAVMKRRRKNRAVRQLVAQIKKQSTVRTQETGSFLQAIYQLDDEALAQAVKTIDMQGKIIFSF